MIKVSEIDIYNLEGAFRGLRNPMNSWAKSDSYFGITNIDYNEELTETALAWHNKELNLDGYTPENLEVFDKYSNWLLDNSDFLEWPDGAINARFIGPNDLKLAQRMIGGGPEEAKFLRQIFVCMDIDAPFFWWKEMDTYKVATVANSCSTMHKLTSEKITTANFSFSKDIDFGERYLDEMYEMIAGYCEDLRLRYLETKDKKYWRALVEILPEGWNQKRTWSANYQVLRNIYFQRRHHKLEEWHEFCKVIEELPYGKELICYEKKD